MNRNTIILLIAVLILGGYCIYLHTNKLKPIIIPQIDTVYVRKDSILNLIKENQSNLNSLDSIYKKDYIRITNQSVNADLEFFTNYLDSVYPK